MIPRTQAGIAPLFWLRRGAYCAGLRAWLRRAGAGAGAVGPALAAAFIAPSAASAGATRCWVDNGAVVTTAAFGDIAGDFIVDTSAPTSALHLTVAQAHGLLGARVVRPLRIAGQRATAFSMNIADLDARERGFPSAIAGVLGADLLARFTLDLTVEPCRITLRRRSTGAGARARVILPIVLVGGVPALTAAIADRSGATRSGWFSIDTASAGVRIAGAAFSRPLPPGAEPASRPAPPARLRALSLGGRLMEQLPASLLEPAPPGLAGALGLAAWRGWRLRLDIRAGRLALMPLFLKGIRSRRSP